MDYRRQLTLLILTITVPVLAADELHFYATPVRVYAGDAVTFHYLGEKGIAREAIASWKWDFDGDGKIDARGSGYSGIDATWYATYDATAGHDPNDVAYLDDNGYYHVSPTLTVTTRTTTASTPVRRRRSSYAPITLETLRFRSISLVALVLPRLIFPPVLLRFVSTPTWN